MNPKIIFFDIDGTLVDPATGLIPESAYTALKLLRENGIMICIATGRPIGSLPDLRGQEFDAMVTFNGSLCYTGEKTIYHCPIPYETVQKVIANAASVGRPVSVAVRDRLVANGIEKDLADYYTKAGLVLTVAEDFEETCHEDVYQIMIGFREPQQHIYLQGTQDLQAAIAWHRAVDIVSSKGGKSNGIQAVLDYFGLDASQAMAFGDSYNDMEMFKLVGTGIAMGNGAQALKDLASDVCGDVSEDGIYRYCLEKGLIQ
jgi:Cof subfamily protein (haloacid dehalogenase superfamily)